MHVVNEQEVEVISNQQKATAFLRCVEESAVAVVDAVRQAQGVVDTSEAQQAAQRIVALLQELFPAVSFDSEVEVSSTKQGYSGRARACAGAIIMALRTAVECCEVEEARLAAEDKQRKSDGAHTATDMRLALTSLYEHEVSVLVDELQACALRNDRAFMAW